MLTVIRITLYIHSIKSYSSTGSYIRFDTPVQHSTIINHLFESQWRKQSSNKLQAGGKKFAFWYMRNMTWKDKELPLRLRVFVQ